MYYLCFHQFFTIHCILEYEELAVNLASDPHRLYEMRVHIENNRDSCAAFDTERWVRNLEKGFLSVWKRRDAGNLPEHIDVEDSDPIFTVNNDALIF